MDAISLKDNSSSAAYLGPAPQSIQSAFETGKSWIGLVESRMTHAFRSDAPALTKISGYLLQQGGKRVRPLLVLLSSKLFRVDEPSSDVVDVAAGIELIHMATLLHDDIIDQSLVRRHQPSAFRQFGLNPSLLTGDFLLVRAFGLCAHLDDYVVTKTEEACVALVEGEILEGTLDGTAESLDLKNYINIIDKKTAALFALSAQLGAYLSGAASADVERMRLFGQNAGIAFQMVDDILDIIANEDLLGKPCGTDLKQKTPSLVNVLWLASGETQARTFFDQDTPTPESVIEARQYLLSSAIIQESRKYAQHYAQNALDALNAIDEQKLNPLIRGQLQSLVEYTLTRCL